MDEMDATINKAKEEIFNSCDTNNEDAVSASALVDFIKLYMADNMEELNKLKLELDPNDENIKVSRSVFYNVMEEWANNIKMNQFNEHENSYLLSLPLEDNLTPISQSTPRCSLGTSGNSNYYSLVKNCSEFLDKSRSSRSNETLFLNNNNSVMNKTRYEEEIVELKKQNQRILTDLDLEKQNMVTAEEQNEALLAERNELLKQLESEKALIKKLSRGVQDEQELMDNIKNLENKISELKLELNTVKKKSQSLTTEVDTLHNQKMILETSFDSLKKQNAKAKFDMKLLESMLNEKENESSNFLKIIEELKAQNAQSIELVSFYMNENEMLKENVNSLKKIAEKDSSYTKFMEFQSSPPNTECNKNRNSLLKSLLTKRTSTPNQNDQNIDDTCSPPPLYVIERSDEKVKINESGDSRQIYTPVVQEQKRSLRDELIEADNYDALITELSVKTELIETLQENLLLQQGLNTELQNEIDLEINNRRKQSIEQLPKFQFDQCCKSHINLECNLTSVQNELEQTKAFIASLCDKIRQNNDSFNCSANDTSNLEKFIESVITKKQGLLPEKKLKRRLDTFNRKEIKLLRLNEKYDDLVDKHAKLEKDYMELKNKFGVLEKERNDNLEDIAKLEEEVMFMKEQALTLAELRLQNTEMKAMSEQKEVVTSCRFCYKTKGFFAIFFFFLILVLGFFCIIHVQIICMEHGRYICPLDSIVQFKRTGPPLI